MNAIQASRRDLDTTWHSPPSVKGAAILLVEWRTTRRRSTLYIVGSYYAPMTDTQARAALVREKLRVDHDVLFAEIVERASGVLRLSDGGDLHPNPDALARMGVRQKVELFLLARYLAQAGSLLDSASATDEEVARFFGSKVQEIQKRAHDLRKDGLIELVDKGTYKLTEGRISEVLRELGVGS